MKVRGRPPPPPPRLCLEGKHQDLPALQGRLPLVGAGSSSQSWLLPAAPAASELLTPTSQLLAPAAAAALHTTLLSGNQLCVLAAAVCASALTQPLWGTKRLSRLITGPAAPPPASSKSCEFPPSNTGRTHQGGGLPQGASCRPVCLTASL